MHSKFSELLPEKRVTNTIDLIEYDSKITDIENFEFNYFNTDNNCYHYKEIEEYGSEKQENMIVTSEFPHGFSLSQGRSLFYYFKTVTFTSLTYFFSKNTEQKLKIMNNFYGSEDSILESAVLDYFDFDTTKLDEEMKKVDWLTELTNPLEENQIILNNKKSMIIV
jgi:hypothetical protein